MMFHTDRQTDGHSLLCLTRTTTLLSRCLLESSTRSWADYLMAELASKFQYHCTDCEAGYWDLLRSLPVTRVQSQAHRAAVWKQNTVLVKISIVLKVEAMNGYGIRHSTNDPLTNLVLDLDSPSTWCQAKAPPSSGSLAISFELRR